jgi:hypothetical protein
LNCQFKWIKDFIFKIHISLNISIYGFQNLPKLCSFVSMASHYFLCQKNHPTKHFSKCSESIIIWYGLWRKVLSPSKVQYVMVTQKKIHPWNSYNVIISHEYYFLCPSHILFIHILFQGPWLIIQQVVIVCNPNLGFAKVHAKSEAQESHSIVPSV